jgi:hypothetical protein
MVVSPVFPFGYSCTPLQSFESLKSLGMDPFMVVLTFYTHASVIDGI